MKKKPEISPRVSDPDLVGSNESSSWVAGRNCVYRDGSVAEYRVSILTPSGWKSYGHFNNVETAAYIANIAILIEGCEERYELNKDIGAKNKEELDRWRRHSSNADLEKLAAEKFEQVKIAMEALHAEQRRQLEEQRSSEREKIAEQYRSANEKRAMILGLSNPDLVKFIKATNLHDPFYEIAMNEAVRRHRALGLPRAT